MKRFLKTLALLVVSLFLVVSGVDAALDHISHSQTQSCFTVYTAKGSIELAYDGDLNAFKAYAKPVAAAVPGFLHRT